ncbi:hypothetical protein OAM69_04270 [bacterium]|nr:hypothetical protein [bacterium]
MTQLKSRLFLASSSLLVLTVLQLTQYALAEWDAKGTVSSSKATLFDIVAIHRPGPQAIDTSYVTAKKRNDNGRLQLALWDYTSITGNSLGSSSQVTLGPIGNDLDLDWFYNADDNASNVQDQRIAVAMIDGRGELRVILWSLPWSNANFSLSESNRLGDNVASGHRTGEIQEVALTVLNDNRLLTAVKTKNSKLKVIAWDVSDDGMTLDRRGSWTSSGEPELIKISRAGDGRAIVAFRNEDENLEVMSFRVNAQGDVTKLSEVVRGRINALDHDGFRSVMRDDDNNLRVIDWEVDRDGTISRETDNFQEGHPTGRVFDVAYDNGLSVMRDDGQRLRVIEWGPEASREGSGAAYTIKGPVKIARGFGYEGAATAALADDDKLRITVWHDE